MPIINGRCSGAAGLLAAAWLAFGMASPAFAQSVQARVGEALDLYAAGDYSRAVAMRSLDGTDVPFAIAALDAWVGPATPGRREERARRGQVAARFIVDVMASRDRTWMFVGVPTFDGQPVPDGTHRLESPVMLTLRFDSQSFTAPLVAWACAHVPKTGPVAPWETGWWLTSIALLQGAGEWGVLLRNQRLQYGGTAPAPWLAAVRKEVEAGHLLEAQQRLGPLPQLQLAEAVSRAASLTDGTRRFALGAGGPRLDGRYDVPRLLEEFARNTNSGRFADIERAFESLLAEPTFEAEVSLHIAQLRLMRRDWDVALRWIDRATAATTDRIPLAIADYFRGWIYERTNRPAHALAAYRAAHERYDLSPNLNTLLANQLMLAGQRTEAARVLERTMRDQHDHAWRDLWLILVEGDARRAPDYARLMREAK